MLKRKIEVGYRKALYRKDGHKRCKNCVNRLWTPIMSCGVGGEVLRHEWRCLFIGVQNSRKYSIADDHICDHFKAKKGTA